jgi:3-oxoacyl-[acyl-carrier protein] reductase
MEKAEEAAPGSFHSVTCDLGEIEHIPQLVKDLEKSFGPIYGLVNNAGISFEGVLAMMPVAQIEKLVRVNTISPIVLTKHVVRSMMASGVGRIVNMSSVVAFTGYNGLSVYSATKASLTGFSRSLAREVGRAGVTVNSVAPGFVDTDMTQGMTKEHRERLEQRSALRRLVQVEDVASAVEFLISDGARNITGTVITVDAGNTA